uniref:(northern house mosquito) hypothetical protein n=1 Tax=Culex pipiens TaxID=7175 RepID=A0A8D8NUB8_CULPI
MMLRAALITQTTTATTATSQTARLMIASALPPKTPKWPGTGGSSSWVPILVAARRTTTPHLPAWKQKENTQGIMVINLSGVKVCWHCWGTAARKKGGKSFAKIVR